jgi:O-antigen/teichoic acid export membrane protein
MLVWLVFTPLVLHRLGPEGFGVWSLFFALTGQLSALDFGLVQGTVRHVAAARARGDHAEAGAFATLALAGYAALAVLWAVALLLLGGPILAWLRIPPALMGEARFALWAGSAVFMIAGFANVVMAVAQGYGRFDVANGVTLALTAQHAAGIPFVLSRGWGLRGLVVNVGVGWTLGLLLGLLLLPRTARGFRWGSLGASRSRAREALAFGGPMQLTSILWTLNLHVDKLLLARFVSLAAVATYELGARVAQSAFTLPQLLLGAVLPTAAALHAIPDVQRLKELHDRVNRYVLGASAVMLAALLASADRLYTVWLGAPPEHTALVLRGLSLSAAVLLAAGTGSVVARGIGRTMLEAWYHVASLSVHVALSLWLLPRIGLAGALIGSIAGNVVGTTLFIGLVARTMRWSFARLLIPPHVVPALAVLAGLGLGTLADRALPMASGASGWAALAAVAATAGLSALVLCLVTRYIRWNEALSLLRLRR